MATMKDVARLAGVSVATVSAVINGKPGVSLGRAQRVREAVDALDYHLNQVARSLRARRTNAIGIVMPQIASPFFTEVLRGVEDEARAHGYPVLVCNSNADPTQEEQQLTMLVARRVDGILLASANPTFAYYYLTRRRIPLVLFDRTPAGFKGPAVTTANVEAACEATRHLIGLGHKQIAIIAGPQEISTAAERLEGFRKALGEAGLRVAEEYQKWGNFRLEGAYQATLELMKLPTPPTAIFSCNYEMTLGMVRALEELGVRCPSEVSVLGFDDFIVGLDGFSWATMFVPKLTTVAQASYEMGKKAMVLLLEKMLRLESNHEGTDEQILRLKAELRIRESTAPPPAEVARLRGGLKA